MVEILVEEKTLGTILSDTVIAQAKGRSSKTKKEEADDDLNDEEVAPKKGAKSKSDDDDDDDAVEGEEQGDDNWDPDFEEFDLPKSRKGKDKEVDEEEDFKVEEEEDFSDMDLLNDSASGGFDEEDDY